MNDMGWGLLVLGVLYSLKRMEDRRRVRLLAMQLRDLHIERLMESLIEAYLRALGEDDAARRAQVWALQPPQERRLASQVHQLANRVDALPRSQTRLGRWWGPRADLRDLLRVHARGLEAVAVTEGEGAAAAPRARTLMAEMLLFQHSCHWFCRSKAVASARLLARHQSSHETVLQRVSAGTRNAYRELLG